jgi:hypothetical protein
MNAMLRNAGRTSCRISAAVAALGLVLSPVAETRAMPQCLPGMCGFTESGKKGPFLKTRVDAADLAKNDAAIATSGSKEGLLAAQSVNRGQLYGTGLSMPATEAQLAALIDTFRPFWPYRPVGPVKVRIVGTNSFVPQSFADNVIVVPFGVLSRARSDGQVVWLLAHEFSHLAMAHFAREARAKKRSRGIGQIVGAVDMATTLSQQRVDTSGNKLRLYEVTDKEAVAMSDSIWARSRQLEGALSLTDAFFSRGDEDKADVAGVDFAVAAGYPYSGALDALEIIGNDDKESITMFDTIAATTGDYAKKTGLQTLGSLGGSKNVGDTLTSWVKDLASNAMVVALKETKKKYLAQHRPSEKRIDGLRKYYKLAYNDAAEKPPSLAFLKSLRATSEYRDADIAVGAYTRALASVIKGNAAQARLDLQPALTTRYGPTPLISNLSAKILMIQGDLRGADQAYTTAERLPGNAAVPVKAPPRKGRKPAPKPAAPAPAPIILRDPYLEQNLQGFQAHVDLLVRMANYPKALAVIAEAKRRFNDDEAFLPQYIAIYMATKQTEMLVVTLNRCLDVADQGLEQSCRAAMLNDSQQKKMAELSPADQDKVDRALARASSKARSGGLLAQINDALTPDDKED